MKSLFSLFVCLFCFMSTYKMHSQKENSYLTVLASILPENYIKSNANLIFTVQVGAYKNENLFLENLENINKYKEDNITKYRIGEFPSYNEAKEYRKMLLSVCRDAFIVPIKNGKRIHIKEALKEALEI